MKWYSVLWMCALLVWIGCGGTSSTKPSQQVYAEAPVEVRNRVATEVLSARPTVVLLYARGLCCPSCAIGVRKTVSRLGFVNRDEPNDGVQLDPKHQLVEVAVRGGQSAVASELWQAIMDAGYDPITIFRMGPNGMETERYTGPLP